MEHLYQILDIVLHLNQYLNEWILLFGPWIYVILFLIIFAETGLIIFPFLPGDSLLFALGALTSGENASLNLPLLCVVLITAAIIGDAVNYAIGRFVGMKLFTNPKSKIFRREHLQRTQDFYDRHGGKTIILARFIPIIRTFAPFVAGVAGMSYPKFFTYNVVGAVVWVVSISVAGNIFGNLPIVQKNFHLVVLAIIVISFIPVLIEAMKARKPA
ncbi:MAG: DedA family protein [Oligoflexia bacterium]|nr:DedA family protein [Oligoflexia bacterium]